jgi:hypothetical protein
MQTLSKILGGIYRVRRSEEANGRKSEEGDYNPDSNAPAFTDAWTCCRLKVSAKSLLCMTRPRGPVSRTVQQLLHGSMRDAATAVNKPRSRVAINCGARTPSLCSECVAKCDRGDFFWARYTIVLSDLYSRLISRAGTHMKKIVLIVFVSLCALEAPSLYGQLIEKGKAANPSHDAERHQVLASYPGYVAGQDWLVSDSAHGQIITDGSWANRSSTLNSAGMAQWTAALVGDVVWGTHNCRPGGAGVASGIDTIGVVVPVGTVTAVNSPTQLTVSTSTTAAVGANGCIVIGQLQDAAMASISAAVNSNTVLCPTVNLPAGVFLISSVPGFLATKPTSCAKNGLVQGQEFGGAGGYLVTGQGPNSTVVSIHPSLLPSGCTNGLGNACFVIPGMTTWQHFRITGNGYAMNGRSDNTKFGLELENNYVGLRDMVFDQWGTGDTGFTGIRFWGTGGGYSWMQDSTVDEWGNLGVNLATGSDVVMSNVLMQNFCGSFSVSLNASTIVSTGPVFIQLPNICSSLTVNRNMLNLAASSRYFGGNGDGIQVGGSSVKSAGVFVDSTSTLQLNGGFVFNTIAGGGFAIVNNGTSHVRNSSILAGTGVGVLNNSTGKFFDDCAIAFIGAKAFVNQGGSVFGTCSATGIASAVKDWALTSGWGTTSVTSAAGDSHRTLLTLTTAAGGSASPVLTWIFPQAYPTVAPVSCVLTLVGGTGSGLTPPFVPSTPSKTSVAWTLGGTPGKGTYIFDANCGP